MSEINWDGENIDYPSNDLILAYELYKAVLVHQNGYSWDEAHNIGGIEYCTDELLASFLSIIRNHNKEVGLW